MTTQRLFHVTLVSDLLVLAENELAAGKIAEHVRLETPHDVDSIQPMSCYPADWDKDCLPFGKPDKTLIELCHLASGSLDEPTLQYLIQLGCAPEYSKFQEHLERVQTRPREGVPEEDASPQNLDEEK